MSTSSRRSRPLIVLGALVIVVGLVAAVVLWGLGDSRRSDTVAGFARAPVGCDTTLDFAESGTYLVYVETAGRLDEVRGDCDVSGDYDVRPEQPEPVLTVVDPDGEAVALESAPTGVDYDDDGFVGTAEFSIDIAEASDHVIRVESPDDAVFVVAVGPDPADGVVVLRVGAMVSAVGGLLLGLGAIMFGSRRAQQPAAAPGWAPQSPGPPGTFAPGQVPQGPPIHAQPNGPPQYGSAVPVPQPPPPGPAPSGPPAGAGFMPPPPPPGSPTPQPRAPHPGPPRIPGQPPLAPTPAPASPYSPPPIENRRADDVARQDGSGDDEVTWRRWPPVPPPE